MTHPTRTSIMQPMGGQHYTKLHKNQSTGKWSGSWTEGTRPEYIIRIASKRKTFQNGKFMLILIFVPREFCMSPPPRSSSRIV